MNIVTVILLVFAFVLFCIAAFGVTHPRINLIAAGLAFWVLSLLATTIVRT